MSTNYMDCNQATANIDDLLDGALSDPQRAATERHLERCTACAARLARERRFRHWLRSQPVPPPSPGFAARALRAAAGRQHRPARLAFAAGFSSAVAAALAVWMVLTPGAVDRNPAAALPAITLTAARPQTVNLVFDAPQALAHVTLTVRLPRDVAVAGFGGRHHLSWQTSLKRGRNLLALPVVLNGGHGGELVATLDDGHKQKSFRLLLETASHAPAVRPAGPQQGEVPQRSTTRA